MSITILRLPAVIERTGLSRSSIYNKISAHEFPRPVSLGARAVGFVAAEIDDWLASRVQLSRSTTDVAATPK